MDTWDSGERYSFVVLTPKKFNNCVCFTHIPKLCNMRTWMSHTTHCILHVTFCVTCCMIHITWCVLSHFTHNASHRHAILDVTYCTSYYLHILIIADIFTLFTHDVSHGTYLCTVLHIMCNAFLLRTLLHISCTTSKSNGYMLCTILITRCIRHVTNILHSTLCIIFNILHIVSLYYVP